MGHTPITLHSRLIQRDAHAGQSHGRGAAVAGQIDAAELSFDAVGFIVLRFRYLRYHGIGARLHNGRVRVSRIPFEEAAIIRRSGSSIKGDVKKKHFSVLLRGGFFLTSSPSAAARFGAGAWIGLREHLVCVVPWEPSRLQAACWPTANHGSI